MTISRRRFLQLGSLASASFLVPAFLQSCQREAVSTNKKLIVIQLSGGNDALNTVIPVRNDIYYRSRPGIAVSKNMALGISDEAALHPSLKGIRFLYDQGYVSIINNVGYEDHSRSHFRSMDMWQSGSSGGTVETGWIGRYMDAASNDNTALEIDEISSLVMKGKYKTALAADHADQLLDHHHEHYAKLAEYMKAAPMEGGNTITNDQFKQRVHAYPDTPLGSKMKFVASMIGAGIGTSVYYISHGSFDTHVAQGVNHAGLLSELDGAITAMVGDMKAKGKLDEVMIVTFSEFGRRVAENESGGTDHGAAGNMFVISGGLRKQGLYNDMPDLTNLHEGDLKHTVDFRRVYSTILDRWLQADSRKILGRNYNHLSFV